MKVTRLLFLLVFLIGMSSCVEKTPAGPDDMVESDPVTDVDGNVYRTIMIGDQIWMAENLSVTHFRNGDPIPNVTDSMHWTDTYEPAYCEYNNSTSFVQHYGRLYNWYAVQDPRNIAPEGWHVPDDSEWSELETFLGMDSVAVNDIRWRGENQGVQLKEIGTAWDSLDTGATNESGFTALPAGYRRFNGRFDYIDYTAFFWTTTEYEELQGWFRALRCDYTNVYRYANLKEYAFSVRCIKDAN